MKDQELDLGNLISRREAECLYHLARGSNGQAIVEIGSFKGKSTIALARGSKAGNRGRVYAIDPHKGTPDRYGVEDTEPIFRYNLGKVGVEDIVTPMVMRSQEVARSWRMPISLLWIDGAHDEKSVRKDFELWEPHLQLGGFIAFHDSFFPSEPGSRRIVKEKILKSSKFSKVGFIGSITFATKVSKLSARAKIQARMKLLIFLAAPWAVTLVRVPLLGWVGTALGRKIQTFVSPKIISADQY